MILSLKVSPFEAYFNRKVQECHKRVEIETQKPLRHSPDLSRMCWEKYDFENPTLAQRFEFLVDRCKNNGENIEQCIENVTEEVIGEEALEHRYWFPMSIKYPRLKAVTDKDVDDFITYRADRNYVNIEPHIYEGIKKKLLEEGKTFENPIEEKIAIHTHYLEEYFKNYQVYDRDEVFEDSKKLFHKLLLKIKEVENLSEPPSTYELFKNTAFVTTPRGGHELLGIFAYANSLPKQTIPSRIRDFTLHSGDEYSLSQLTIKSKSGLTWLGGDKMDNIDRVVFLDDIVASGEQTFDALTELQMTFSPETRTLKKKVAGTKLFKIESVVEEPINLYFLSLCRREYPKDWQDMKDFDKEGAKFLYDHSVWVHLTSGIEDFKAKMGHQWVTGTAKTVNCAFAWSIPDGASDYHIKDLYAEVGRTGAQYQTRTISPARKVKILREKPRWTFLEDVDKLPFAEQKKFVDKVLQDKKLTGEWGYLSTSEIERVKKLMHEFLTYKDNASQTIGNISGQPYNIPIWKEEWLKGIGYGKDKYGRLIKLHEGRKSD